MLIYLLGFYIYFIGCLPGVHIVSEVTITVTNEAKLFHWKDYGLKLTIPPDSLPPTMQECPIAIKAISTGQFKIPENRKLVSAVYWLQSPMVFEREITLEIEHCAKPTQSSVSSLSFITSRSDEELPYRFEPLPRGIFSPDGSHRYGTINISHFSNFAIAGNEPQYCAQLYYNICDTEWRVHFVITKDLAAHIKVSYSHFIVW